MVAAAELVDGVRQDRPEHGQAVAGAAGRAGQVDHSVRPATPASPRDSAAVGTLSRLYARIASAMPGTS